jgi:coenzyme F420 biosynthesis associated uncharacterized protein
VATSSSLVDWDIAARVGSRLARPGPELSRAEARAVVRDLREGAVEARAHVRAYTGLDAPAADAPVEVVDRDTWIRANTEGMRRLLEPLEESLARRVPTEAVRRIGSAVTGGEVGAALAWLSGKVLGQFEVYGVEDHQPGRLLLVAPNIAQAERELSVDGHDFRLWVCLHEETHRVQFTAVPWLRSHVIGEIRELLGSLGRDMDSGELAARARDLMSNAARAVRGEGQGLTALLQSPDQQERVARLTAIMSLLEGHADVVMDGVGPEVVPTVADIREAFQRRREQPGRLEGIARRMLGLDAKLRQYRDGAEFVRAVLATEGMAGFNRVWDSPKNLPSEREIHHPAEWVSRVAVRR